MIPYATRIYIGWPFHPYRRFNDASLYITRLAFKFESHLMPIESLWVHSTPSRRLYKLLFRLRLANLLLMTF